MREQIIEDLKQIFYLASYDYFEGEIAFEFLTDYIISKMKEAKNATTPMESE